MPIQTSSAAGVTPRRPLTAPLRQVVATRVYADLPDGSPLIIDVPLGTDHRPIADGVVGTRVRVHELDSDGSSIWCIYRPVARA